MLLAITPVFCLIEVSVPYHLSKNTSIGQGEIYTNDGCSYNSWISTWVTDSIQYSGTLETKDPPRKRQPPNKGHCSRSLSHCISTFLPSKKGTTSLQGTK